MVIHRFIRIRIIFFCILFAFFFHTVESPVSVALSQAEEPEPLTLSTAVDKALKNNPLIRIALSGGEIADAKLREARAGWLPLLQFSETFARGNNPVFVFGSLLEQSRFRSKNFEISSLNNPDPLSNFRTAITFRQAVFDQLQTYSRVNQARLGKQQADLQKALVEQQVRFEVIRAYFGVLVAHAKKDVAVETTKMAEADLNRIRDRFERGMVVQSDLLAGEVQLGEFRQQEIDSDGDVAVAYADLNTVMGLPIDTVHKVKGRLVDKQFETVEKEKYLRLALLHRPDYVQAGYSILSNREGVRGARREFLPRLDFMATYGGSGKDLSSGSSDYTVSAHLTFNLFDAGRNARISKARAEESMAVAEQQRLINQICLEVVRAYQQYVSARERLVVARQMIDQAAETHRIVQNRYREGLITITEVLRAQTALVRSRLSLIAARYDQYVSYAHVLLSVGKLTDMEPFLL
ncbi:MAG: TolC family protein [Thermodesulfobacteriota bacterium]